MLILGKLMKEIESFVSKLLTNVPELSETYEETIKYWEKNPPILLLLADLGRELARLKDINENSLKSILDLVELEILSENEKISTAFATGFLEAFYFEVERQLRQDKIYQLLGENSKNHVNWSPI